VIASQLVPGSPTSDGLGLRRNEQVLSTIQADYDLRPNLRVRHGFEEIMANSAAVRRDRRRGGAGTLSLCFLHT
jgi:hypothetical protein